jgi:hypothetical protein
LQLVAVKAAKATVQMDLDLALIEAAGQLNHVRVSELLDAGARASFRHNPEGIWGSQDAKTALHMALDSRVDTGPEERKAIVTLLLNAKADVNAKRSQSDWRGCGSSCTAFEMALRFGMQDAALLEQFLAAGANANTKKEQHIHSMRSDGCCSEYLLHQAVRSGHRDAVRTLLDARADVDALQIEHIQNERGFNRDMEQTALHIACAAKDVPMAALLLARGADPNFPRKDLDQEERPRPEPAKKKSCKGKASGANAKSKKCRSPSPPSDIDDPRSAGYVSPVICLKVEETALHIALLKKQKPPALAAMLVCVGADASRERRRGDVRRTPVDMCGEDQELLQALDADWSCEEFRALFPTEVLPDIEAAVAVRATRVAANAPAVKDDLAR